MKEKLNKVLLSNAVLTFPLLTFPMLSLADLPIPIHTPPTLVWKTAPAAHVIGDMRASNQGSVEHHGTG